MMTGEKISASALHPVPAPPNLEGRDLISAELCGSMFDVTIFILTFEDSETTDESPVTYDSWGTHPTVNVYWDAEAGEVKASVFVPVLTQNFSTPVENEEELTNGFYISYYDVSDPGGGSFTSYDKDDPDKKYFEAGKTYGYTAVVKIKNYVKVEAEPTGNGRVTIPNA